MKLPPELEAAFRQETGHPPLVSARALYDLSGKLGETFLAAHDQSVMFFSKSLGGARETRVLSWTEIQAAELRRESIFIILDLQTRSGPVRLQFSSWAEPAPSRVLELWSAAKGSSKAQPPGPVPTLPPVAAIPPPLSPVGAFCAGIHALIRCDERIEPAELNFLSARIPYATAIEEGRQFLERHGLEVLCRHLPRYLNPAQQRCLMANLIGVAMVDGVLQSKEHTLLDHFQKALDFPAAEAETLFKALMTKNNLAVFASQGTGGSLPEADGLTPLMAYCAALLAMMDADRQATPAEQELLSLTIPYPEEIELGRDYLHAYGLDHLLSRLSRVLARPQRLCLLANLIALAMVDGLIRSSENELLDRFQQALELAESDFASLYEALMIKNNLSVLAA